MIQLPDLIPEDLQENNINNAEASSYDNLKKNEQPDLTPTAAPLAEQNIGGNVTPEKETISLPEVPDFDKIQEDEEKADELRQMHYENVQNLAASLFTDAEILELKKKGKVGVLESIKRFGVKDALAIIPYVGSAMGAASSAEMLNLSRKYNAKEILSTEEEQKLKDYLKKLVELEIRGGTTNAGAITQGIPEVLSFMLEIGAAALVSAKTLGAAAPAAAGSLAKKATAFTAKKVLQKQITGKIGRAAVYAGRGAKFTARSAQIAAAMPTSIAENYYNRRLLVEGLTLTDKGQEVFAEVEEKPFTTFMKAYGDIFTEVFAEGTGVLLSKGIKYAASPVGKRIANSIPDKMAQKLKTWYAEMHPNNKWSKLISDNLMFNGFLEELGENRISELLKIGFGVNLEQGSTIEQIQHAIFPGTDEFLVEAGLVGVLSGSAAATRVLAEKMVSKGNTEKEIKDRFAVTPVKQLEQQANGEVKDVTPNFSLEEDKSFGAKEYREGAKLIPQLSVKQSQRETLQELQEARGEKGKWGKFKSSVKRSFLDKFYFLKSLSPMMRLSVTLREGVPGQAKQAFSVLGPTYTKEDGTIVYTGVTAPEKVLQAMYAEMGNNSKSYEEFQQVGQVERLLWLANKRGSKKAKKKVKSLKESLIRKIGEEKYNQYLKHAKRISDYVHALQYGEYMEGVIDEPTYFRRYSENGFYWPMKREFEEDNDMKAPVPEFGSLQSKAVSKADASLKEASINTELEVQDLSANLALLTLQSYARRANHKINKELYRIAQEGTYGDFIRLPITKEDAKMEEEITGENVEPDKLEGADKMNTFKFFLDGEEKTIVVSRLIIPALTDTNPAALDVVTNILRSFSNILRQTATTYNLAYSLMNPMKDQFVAFFQTDVGYIPFVDLIGGLRSYITKDKHYASFLASGASNSGFIEAGNTEDAKKYAKKLAKKASFLDSINVFNHLENISTAMENATRIGVFKRASKGNVIVEDALVLPCEAELRQRELNAFIRETAVKGKIRGYLHLKKKLSDFKTEKLRMEAQWEVIEKLPFLTEEQKKSERADYDKYMESLNKRIEAISKALPKVKEDLEKSFVNLEKWHTKNYEMLKSLRNKSWVPNTEINEWLYGKDPEKTKEFLNEERAEVVEANLELTKLNERLQNNKRVAIERLVQQLKDMDPQETSEKVEAIPLRIEIFRRSQEEGLSIQEAGERAGLDLLSAAFVARNATTDFSVMGEHMKLINSVVPFTNAQVQSWRIFYENFKNNWALATMKALIGHTAPTIAALAWNLYGADDETREEWLEMPEWRKEAFINIKLFGVWFSIPRPFEYGWIFGNVPERTLEQMYREDKKKTLDFINDLTKSGFNMAMPVDLGSPLPSGLLSLVEVLANYNFFKQKAIVPEFMTKLEPKYQYREDTSLTARKLGEWFNISPMKFQNFVNTQFAGAGKDALRLSDYIINSLDDDIGPTPSKGLPGVWGLSSVFRGDPIGFRSKSVTDFYDLYSKIEKKRNSYNALQSQDSVKARDYREKNKKWLDSNQSARDYRKKLQNLSKEINKVKADDRYTADEKRDIITYKESLMTEIAKRAVKNLRERLEEND